MNALSTTKFQKKTNAQNQCYVYKKYNFCNENEIPSMAINGFVLTKMNFNKITELTLYLLSTQACQRQGRANKIICSMGKLL